MLKMSAINPRQTAHHESGLGLDAIGAMKGVDLPRNGVEPDIDYCARLMVRLWEPLVAELTPKVATGEYLDRWLLNNTAPADDAKPNHARE